MIVLIELIMNRVELIMNDMNNSTHIHTDMC